MGLYQQPSEEWDRLAPVDQTWITLQALIQEAFQCCLNVTAPTAGYQGFVPAQPFQQNMFGILGKEDNEEDNISIANKLATQVVALTYQSQLTQSTTANTSQRQEQQMAQIAAVQGAMYKTLDHSIAGMNALAFNVSGTGCGCYI
jgi:hypothetical protein